MLKKTVTLTIDADVWIAFQTQVDDRQRSATITNLLRHYLTIHAPNSDENEIRDRLQKINDQREILMQEAGSLSAELAIIQSDRKHKQEVAEKWADIVTKSNVRSPWEDVE